MILLLGHAAPLAGQGQGEPGQAHARLSGEVYTFSLVANGSPYLWDAWAPGDVELVSGAVIVGQSLKYNGYLDELIWYNTSTGQQVMVEKRSVQGFSLSLTPHDNPLVFRKIPYRSWYGTPTSDIYAQVLYEGDLQLLAYRNIKKTGEQTIFTESGIAIQLSIGPAHEYFLLGPAQQPMYLRKVNRRTLNRLFPGHRSEVRQAFRGVRIHTDTDRVEVISRFDRLLQEEGL